MRNQQNNLGWTSSSTDLQAESFWAQQAVEEEELQLQHLATTLTWVMNDTQKSQEVQIAGSLVVKKSGHCLVANHIGGLAVACFDCLDYTF